MRKDVMEQVARTLEKHQWRFHEVFFYDEVIRDHIAPAILAHSIMQFIPPIGAKVKLYVKGATEPTMCEVVDLIFCVGDYEDLNAREGLALIQPVNIVVRRCAPPNISDVFRAEIKT